MLGRPALRGGNWQADWRALVVLFIAGALLPLAFAPFQLYPLAILSPAVLFWLWSGTTSRRGFICGYVFGLGFFGVGVSWVAVSMYRFSGMGMSLAVLATLLFVLFLALFPALMGWLARRYGANQSPAIHLLLCLPALWVLLEWVRGWILTGFPWLLLGYSHTDSPLIGVAPVLGVYGVSWLSALSASLLVWLWLKNGRARIGGLAAVVAIWIVAAGLTAADWSEPYGQPLAVSLIQGNIDQNQKWADEYRAHTIDVYTRLSRSRWGRDVIVWPETAMPVYFHQANNYLQQLAIEARENGGTQLVLGIPVGDNEGYFNGVVSPGEKTQFYFKSHLVPFGEYIPLKPLLGDLLDLMRVPMADFSSGGARQAPMDVAGVKAGVSICYEDAFGEEVIRGLPAANMLINVTNDAWFGDSLAPHQHLQMARMRTLETARPMLRATNNGVSALIDHRGRLLGTSPQFEQAILDGNVQPRQGATPYALTGNWLIISVMLIALLLSVMLSRCKTRSQTAAE